MLILMWLTKYVYLCCLPAKCFLVRHFTWLHSSAVPRALQGWHTSWDVHIFVLFMFPLPAGWWVYIKYNHQRWHLVIWCLQKQQKHARPAVTRCLTQILYLILYWSTAKLFSYFTHSTRGRVTKFQFPRSLKLRCHFETTGIWNWKTILHMNDCDWVWQTEISVCKQYKNHWHCGYFSIQTHTENTLVMKLWITSDAF